MFDIKKISLLLIIAFISMLLLSSIIKAKNNTILKVKSIDTMKYSRDIAREKLNDLSYDQKIEEQIRNIAATGATHVAIATPYDAEFLPYLKRWVTIARKYNLNIWFRGNLSGWEKWFGYSPIDAKTHTAKTREFVLNNKDIFQNGDIFTSCPECENGNLGDPRTGDVSVYRSFLINEYTVIKDSFKKINKNVTCNYYSMNGDVARLVMDKKTTQALDGVVTIDHYVDTPDHLIADIKEFAANSGGKVVLGEIGVPIPDINGDLSEQEQAQWLAEFFNKLYKEPEVIGINYWVNMDSTTAIWEQNGTPKIAQNIIKNYYSNKNMALHIVDSNDNPLYGASVKIYNMEIQGDEFGNLLIPYIYPETKITILIKGYYPLTHSLNELNTNKIVAIHKIPDKNESVWLTINTRSVLTFLFFPFSFKNCLLHC